jgi:hypothetical protein
MKEQDAVGIKVFEAKSTTPSLARSGCSFCDVPLCKRGSCFQDWHDQK